MLTTATAYQFVAGNITQSLTRTAAQPVVARESAYYLEAIVKVKSIEDFMKDDRLFAYAMKAHGLADMTYAKAFMRKALEGGIDDPDSFANKLSDTRYRDFVETFNFVRNGANATVFTRAQQGTVDRYVRQTLEEDAGAANEGVRLALYFERKASSVKSAYGLLADPALLKVVQVTFGIPASMSTADIDRQAALFDSKLDVADLKDPEKVKRLMQRFTAMWDIENGTAAATSPAILISQPREAGIGADLLMSLQRLKLGGS
ncbi:DUF1217 domain-containing protein [Faunimonas sp. B44]|uniref:DUF1217 domain-containing protein n=1 Tax=Faunimonas sp. B44 TaxID=3461493 RepID=UPI004043AC0A